MSLSMALDGALSLATEQLCVVFNLFFISISLMLFFKLLMVTFNGVGRSLHPWLLNSFVCFFNLFEHNPYLDLTYALFKAVGGHCQWCWLEH